MTSLMYSFFARMYKTGKVDETRLQTAVDKGYITSEERDAIITAGRDQ